MSDDRGFRERSLPGAMSTGEVEQGKDLPRKSRLAGLPFRHLARDRTGHQGAPPERPEGRLTWRHGLRQVPGFLSENIVWVIFVVFLGLGRVLSSFFLTTANLQNISVQATVLSCLGLGIGFTLLIGAIDLSVAGNMLFAGVVGAVLSAHVPAGVAILGALAVGAAVGAFNGVCVVWLGMNSLIETLAVGLALGGAVLAVTKGQTLVIQSSGYNAVGTDSVLGWPVMPIVAIILYAAAYVFLNRTPGGRAVYATGGNSRAAFAAGILVPRVRFQVFLLSGFVAGVGGWVESAYLQSIGSSVGTSILLYAVAAPVMGGVSLFGGRGKVSGMLGGALLLTVIQVGLQIIHISSYYVDLIGGVVILLAVLLDAMRLGKIGQGAARR